jgi:phage portal protein BeeE
MTNTPFILAQQSSTKTGGFDFSYWGGIEGFLEASKLGGSNAASLKRLVPDVAKAVDMTAAAISGLPFDILDENGDVYDSSADWQNKIVGMPNPQRLLYLLASSLCGGSAYLLPFRTTKMIVDLQYCAPSSITPYIDMNGLQYFSRATERGKSEAFIKPDNIIYFWLPDSDVEIGPALNHPLENCKIDAQTVYALKETIRKFGERNFAPLTLLGVKGNIPQGEREKTENFFDRLLRFGFREKAKVVNTDALSIEQLSAGMEELKQSYLELRNDAKESIADAFGIPPAMFMADKAYASEMDVLTRQWYKASRFVVLWQTIEETFTEQLLKPFKLSMRFNLDSLDIFQEDESARASSLGSLVSAVADNPEVAKLGMSILGYDLSKEQGKQLEALIKAKEEAREEMREQTKPTDEDEQDKPVPPGEGPTTSPFTDDNPPEDEEPEEEKPVSKSATLTADEIKDLALWYDRSRQWYVKGKGTAVDWENKHLSETIAAPIRLRLAEAKSEADIAQAFYIGETTTLVPAYKSETVMLDAQVEAIKALAATIEKAIEKAKGE